MTKQRIHIAALAAMLVGGSWAIAGAQSETSAPTPPATGSMNSSMMGNDPVRMCMQMMATVSRDPKLHQEMNRMMNDVMSKDRTK